MHDAWPVYSISKQCLPCLVCHQQTWQQGKLKHVWLEYPTYLVKFLFLLMLFRFAKSRQGAVTIGMMMDIGWAARRGNHALLRVVITWCLSGTLPNFTRLEHRRALWDRMTGIEFAAAKENTWRLLLFWQGWSVSDALWKSRNWMRFWCRFPKTATI